VTGPDPVASGPPCPSCGTVNRPGARFCRNCGVALSGIDVPNRSVWRFVQRVPRGRRRAVVITVVVLVALVCGGYLVIEDTLYTPDQPVRALFAALAAKDGAALAGIDNCTAVCQAGGLGQGYEPPTHLRIVSVSYGGAAPDDPTRRPDRSRAGVRVRYDVGGTTYDDVVGVSRPDSGLLRPWSISGPPGGYVQILSDSLPSAKIAGATMATVAPNPDLPRRSGSVFVPPGVYVVTGTQSALWESTPVRLVVAGDLDRFGDTAGQRVELNLRVKSSVVDEVRKQIRARIDKCATMPSFSPKTDRSAILSDCPFSALEDYSFTKDLHWTVLDYPQIELRIDDDHSVKVHTVSPGHARLDYSYTLRVVEPRPWTPTSQTVEVTPRGDVVEDGGTIVWRE
jgi:zinc-ribbon domain